MIWLGYAWLFGGDRFTPSCLQKDMHVQDTELLSAAEYMEFWGEAQSSLFCEKFWEHHILGRSQLRVRLGIHIHLVTSK